MANIKFYFQGSIVPGAFLINRIKFKKAILTVCIRRLAASERARVLLQDTKQCRHRLRTEPRTQHEKSASPKLLVAIFNEEINNMRWHFRVSYSKALKCSLKDAPAEEWLHPTSLRKRAGGKGASRALHPSIPQQRERGPHKEDCSPR